MNAASGQAELYLNGVHVGTVVPNGLTTSWEYGEFTPADAFSKFASLFGLWSLMIHEDDGGNRTSREALAELRNAEVAIDSLRAELLWPDSVERVALSQVNIDGSLIEWKRQ